jgi:hypothetical protein
VDELDLAVVLAVPSPARAAFQAANDHVDRPLGLLERVVEVAYLQRGRQVALVASVFQLLVTSPVITAIVVLASTSVATAVVVVAT